MISYKLKIWDIIINASEQNQMVQSSMWLRIYGDWVMAEPWIWQCVRLITLQWLMKMCFSDRIQIRHFLKLNSSYGVTNIPYKSTSSTVDLFNRWKAIVREKKTTLSESKMCVCVFVWQNVSESSSFSVQYLLFKWFQTYQRLSTD